jgi:protein phosphatase
MTGDVSVAAGSRTDTGLKRALNEDSVLARYPVYLIADGMGGHDRGDRASALLVEAMARFVGRRDVTPPEVRAVLADVGHRISGLGGRDRLHTAGTTVSGLIVVEQNGEPYWLVVNLGDSRTYRLADGRLERVSVDHSEVQELVDTGAISQDMARLHPRRNVVTKILGAGIPEEPDYWLWPVEGVERWLVCSDGLTAEASDDDIERLLLAHAEPQGAADALVGLALEAGGRDNISVVVVDARADDGSIASPTIRSGDEDEGEETVPRGDVP